LAFNRELAVKYAEKHWSVPCDDGLVWLTNDALVIEKKRKELNAPASAGWQAMFVRGSGADPEKAVFRRSAGPVIEEKLISGWAGLADCAHFLSRCLTAGGANISERGVRELVEKLQRRSDTKTLCERVTRDRAQRVIDSGIFKRGDMIGYFNVSPIGDFGGRQAYTHSTMYVGKIDSARVGGVTCHTVARFPPKSWVNDSWWLHDGYTYTLIHFSGDDPVPHNARALAGWWKLVYAGRTEYYYVLHDGRARYTKRAPASAAEALHIGEGTAYWFVNGVQVTFIWKATGTCEVWSPRAGAGGYNSMINGTTPGAATRLF